MLLICIVLLLAAGNVGGAPRSGSRWDEVMDPNVHSRRRCAPLRSLDEDTLHKFDVIRLEPHLTFDLSSGTLSGFLITELVADEIPLDRVDLRFTHSLTIDSVWAEDTLAVAWTAQGIDSLQLLLSSALPVGDTVRIGIAYHGAPAIIDSWGGLRFAQAGGGRPQIAFSMGDGLNLDPPPANYNWIPSHADPTDKVTWEAWLRAAGNRIVSSNGMRLDTVRQDDGSIIWHYRLDPPVSTYLLFVAISDYVIMTQRESGPLIENFIYPGYVQPAQTHFSNVPAVLDGFAERFGPYPFERFGYAQTRIGDMEHATCVSHYDLTVQANHRYDWLLFHELSHQWWGDWVTCGDWRDLWLNEGFGTYCEAIGMEVLNGYGAYRSYVESDIFGPALNTAEDFPIYDPDYYWGATVYEKGAAVMHMLRNVLGDSLFFGAWREYGEEHAYGAAVTSEWQAKLEEFYGSSLDWFFQPWIYGRRYPIYEVHWGSYYPIQVMQVQSTGTLFRMPMDIVGRWNEQWDTTMVWVEALPVQSFDFHELFPGFQRLDSIVIDPENKVLKTISYYRDLIPADPVPTLLPARFDITTLAPNPFNSVATMAFDLPRPTSVRLTVFDLTGREVEHRDLGSMSAGSHRIEWNGSCCASGIYLFSLESDHQVRMVKGVLLK